ncbi:hypothetical protein NDU88_001351 [Pleurodeles waltl]|uniref:Uncharacterized protein n=1 Tax=Pleurodeles waltl TaxID=8319 RepID=A0AAV7Q6L1_PLEWA|nr:hypothetical protein NDU88_001351 [Pleurodeles waltl]
MGVIPTLAVHDRQGRGQRKHRQQAASASWAILTAAVFPWPRESSMAALLAVPPWGFRPPSRHPVPGGFYRQEQDGGNGCRGAPGGPTKIFTVCLADSENRDRCHCTRRTPATPPAPFGFIVAGPFPLGRRALFWRAPAGPAGKLEWPPRSFDRGAVIRR